MLYKGLKCASLVILLFAIGACDGSALTGPDVSGDVNRAACVPAGDYVAGGLCSSESDEFQEPAAADLADEDSHPKPTK